MREYQQTNELIILDFTHRLTSIKVALQKGHAHEECSKAQTGIDEEKTHKVILMGLPPIYLLFTQRIRNVPRGLQEEIRLMDIETNGEMPGLRNIFGQQTIASCSLQNKSD